MRRLFFYAVVGLLLGAGLVALIEQDPGYIFINWRNTSIETSLWFGLSLALLMWLVLAVSLRLLGNVLRSRLRFMDWLGNRKSRNATALSNRGLINFVEGNWEQSRKQLLRAARYSEAPLLNHLIAARASFRLGDVDEARHQLGLAETIDVDAGIAVELTQAELQLTAGQYEQALATLVRARANASKHPYVLELLARAHFQLEDWEALKQLLPDLKKHDLGSSSQLVTIERATWLGLMAAAVAAPDSKAALEATWRAMPSDLKQQNDYRRRFIKHLSELGANEALERYLVDFLDKQWDSELVNCFRLFPPKHPQKLIKKMDRWLTQQGREPRLVLTTAYVALHAHDWELAEACLLEVSEQEEATETRGLLWRLYLSMGREHEASQQLEKMSLALLGEVDLPLPGRSGDD